MAKRKKNRKKKKKELDLPSLPVHEPTSWLGIAVRVWIIHLAALVVYMVFAVIGYTFTDGHTLYMVITLLSLIFYLTMCYIVAMRSGNRDNAYEVKMEKPVSKWGTAIGALISQCPGLVLAVSLQFLSSDSLARQVYEYLYMPFAYPVSMFEKYYRVVFFIPLLFAPIMMVCAYFTGRMAPVKDQKPSKRLIRLGARISGLTKKKKK